MCHQEKWLLETRSRTLLPRRTTIPSSPSMAAIGSIDPLTRHRSAVDKVIDSVLDDLSAGHLVMAGATVGLLAAAAAHVDRQRPGTKRNQVIMVGGGGSGGCAYDCAWRRLACVHRRITTSCTSTTSSDRASSKTTKQFAFHIVCVVFDIFYNLSPLNSSPPFCERAHTHSATMEAPSSNSRQRARQTCSTNCAVSSTCTQARHRGKWSWRAYPLGPLPQPRNDTSQLQTGMARHATRQGHERPESGQVLEAAPK